MAFVKLKNTQENDRLLRGNCPEQEVSCTVRTSDLTWRKYLCLSDCYITTVHSHI